MTEGEQETRVLALDVGEKRIGVAVTEWGGIVTPLAVLDARAGAVEAIRRIVEERDLQRIVVGLPVSLDDSLGPQAQKVLSFIRKLEEQVSVPIVTVDERFTSVDAEERLIDADVSRAKRRATLDRHAAAEILASYLRSRR